MSKKKLFGATIKPSVQLRPEGLSMFLTLPPYPVPSSLSKNLSFPLLVLPPSEMIAAVKRLIKEVGWINGRPSPLKSLISPSAHYTKEERRKNFNGNSFFSSSSSSSYGHILGPDLPDIWSPLVPPPQQSGNKGTQFILTVVFVLWPYVNLSNYLIFIFSHHLFAIKLLGFNLHPFVPVIIKNICCSLCEI